MAVVAGLATVSVGVAAYALVGPNPSRRQNVACFASADLDADTAVVDVDRRGPVAACADVWAQGIFGPLVPLTLRACVLESGVVGVFPEGVSQDVCLELRLAPVAPSSTSGPQEPEDPASEADRFLVFRDAVLARFVDQACVEPGPAAMIVREELDRADLGGWTVLGGAGQADVDFSPERPCASLSFLPEQRAVALVPIPSAPTPR